ncbi:MAG TPA: hypothetical protein VNM90_03860 [Haliangium sp.]|nr:hypothetical protein [Haliangium sp.]
MVSQPVANAIVQVRELDDEGRITGPVRFETRTDGYGRFELNIEKFPELTPDGETRPYLVTAKDGMTRMLGSDERIQLTPEFADGYYAQAVVTNAPPGARFYLTLSPLTTLAKALGDQRFAQRLEPTYQEAAHKAYVLMSEHFLLDHVDFVVDLRSTVPEPPDVLVTNGLTHEVRYMLALAAMWTLEQSIAARSAEPLPLFSLFETLTTDAFGPQAIFDGLGQQGKITVGTCTPACELSSQTLRTELTETMMSDFIPSPANGTGLDFPDIVDWLYQVAGNDEIALFGNEPPQGFDDMEPPVATALASPFFDESENRVRFDARLQAVHEHTPAALVDLAATLGGLCDQVLHKHVDTLRAAVDENPLRWRLAVRDDLAGVDAADIRAVLRPGGAGPGYELGVSPVLGLADGAGRTFDIVAPGHISELATVEGRFELEIQARDRLENLAAPVVGCWQHVPLAAPVHQAPLALVSGPGSLAAVNLDNDDVATLLGGTVSAALGLPLARIPVTNGSGAAVYLTPRLDEVAGTYDRTWIAARALVRADELADTCIAGNPPTCATTLPRAPRLEDRVIARPLPALTADDTFLALRVLDAQSGQAVTCDECRPGEARLDPGRSYEVQVVATRLDFLVPEGADPGRVARIQVGPADDRHRLVGIVDEVGHVVCASPDQAEGICRGHRVFDLYQALTEARIDIQSVRISARTAPGPSLPPRTPRPAAGGGDGTFSTPLSTSYEWSAAEPRMPAEGGL